MISGEVPGVGKPVSRLVQGTVMLSTRQQDRSSRLLDEIFAAGGTAFDTAHGYGGGDCERALGTWLRDAGLREQVVIVGKGAHPHGHGPRVTPEDITSDLHESLERMGTEYIDLYLLHRDDPAVPVGPIVEVLDGHRRAGRIRAYGGSNWSHGRIREANEYAAEHGLTPFAATSPNYSLVEQLAPPWDDCLSISGPQGAEARASYQQAGLPVFAWSSLAGGFLSGTVDEGDLSPPREGLEMMARSYAGAANFERLHRARQLAAERGLSVPQVALAWLLSDPLTVYPLVGCATGEEFRACVAATTVHLSPEARVWLESGAGVQA